MQVLPVQYNSQTRNCKLEIQRTILANIVVVKQPVGFAIMKHHVCHQIRNHPSLLMGRDNTTLSWSETTCSRDFI